MKKLIIIIALMMSVSSLYGQKWERTDISFGAKIKGISFNSKGTLLLLTAKALYKSEDLGESWKLVKLFSQGGNLRNSVLGESDEFYYVLNSTLYQETEDGTTTFGSFSSGFTNLKYINDRVFFASSGVYSNSGQKLSPLPYFKELLKTKDGDLLLFADNVSISTDTGMTWRAIEALAKFNAVEIDELNNLYFGYETEGIRKSSDSAKTLVETGLNNAKVTSIRYIGNGELLAATNQGLMKSLNRGETWVSTILSDTRISSIAYSKGIVFAISDTARVIYRSSDRGENWTEVIKGLAEEVMHTNMIIDDDGIIYCSNGNKIFKISQEGKKQETIVHRRQDVDIIECKYDNNNIFYAFNGFLFRNNLSTNKTDSIRYYVPKPTINKRIVKIDSNYYTAGKEIIKINKNFDSISSFALGPFDSQLFVDKSYDGNYLFAYGGSDFFVLNNELNIMKKGNLNSSINNTQGSMVLNSKDKIFIWGPIGLFMSSDTGSTWQNVLSNVFVYKSFITKDDILILGTTKGILIANTINEKINIMNLITNGLPDINIRNFVVDKQNNIYAYTNHTGVYKLANVQFTIVAPQLTYPENQDTLYSNIDNKLAWEEVSGAVEYDYQVSETAGFEENEVLFSSKIIGANEVELAELEYGKTYFWRVKARNGFGIESEWSEIWSFYVEKDTYIHDEAKDLISISPNPAKETIEVKSNEIIETIGIYNLTGQLVLHQSVNTDTAKIDLKGLTKGAYIITITSNGKVFNRKLMKE